MFYFHKVVYLQYLGEVDIYHTWVNKFPPLYNSAKIKKKSIKIFQSYDHKCTATFFVVHSVYPGLALSAEIQFLYVIPPKKPSTFFLYRPLKTLFISTRYPSP